MTEIQKEATAKPSDWDGIIIPRNLNNSLDKKGFPFLES
jgi:hypothetical protein